MYGSLKLLDLVVKCPYDNHHLIARSRLQKHIVKCEKNYPPNYKVMCPFNATHRLFMNELEEHIVTCPTRNVRDASMYPEPRQHGATNFQLHSEISSVIECTENWDLEVDDPRDFADQNCSSVNNIETFEPIFDTKVRSTAENKDLRAPRGFSEAMMREENEESGVEDVESVISSMGIGRGKITLHKDKLKLIGLGRGRPMNTNF